jgi:hypothetical protein
VPESALATTPAVAPGGAAAPGAVPGGEPTARRVGVQVPALAMAPASAAPCAATPGTVGPTPTAPSATTPSAATPTPHKPWWMAGTPAGRRPQRHQLKQAGQRMQPLQAEHRQSHPKRSKRQRRPIERLVVSPTEPEAALGIDKLKTFRPLYNVPCVGDLDSPFILGHEVFAAVTDHNMLQPMVQKTQHLTGHKLRQLAGDTLYARVLDLVWCQKRDITVYAPVGKEAAAKAAARPPKQLPKRAFTWLPEQQTDRCPEGHVLEFARTGKERRGPTQELTVLKYRCAPAHGQACPRQSACTAKPEQGRTIQRSEHEDLVDALRQRMQEPAGKALYKLRKQTVERGYADIKTHRGLQRFRSYGVTRARIQVGLLVLVHNAVMLRKARQEAAACAASPEEEPT